MKRLLVIPIVVVSLIVAACAGPIGSTGGGSFDDTTPVAAIPTQTLEPRASGTPVLSPTLPPTAAVPACAPGTLNLGDPALWREGAKVVIRFNITDAALLPARLQSDNGLDSTLQTLDEFAGGVEYGPLSLNPSATRTLTLTLANRAVCSATVTVLTVTAVPTSVPTNTPLPTATLTRTPIPPPTSTTPPTLAPVVGLTPTRVVILSTATPTNTRAPTATPASLPVTGGGEGENQPPKSPLDQIWELIQILLGGW